MVFSFDISGAIGTIHHGRCVHSTIIAALFLCASLMTVDSSIVTKDVLGFRTLEVRVDPGIQLTWEIVKGTRNLTVHHTPELTVNLEEQSGLRLKVDISSPRLSEAPEWDSSTVKSELNSTIGSNATPTVQSSMALQSNATPTVQSSMALQLWIMLLGMWLFRAGAVPNLLLMALLSGNTIAGDAKQSNVPPSTAHMFIPAQLISSICVNGVCSPVLCRLSLISRYSDVPSNSFIFSNGNCSLKAPSGWDAWLNNYFGSESFMQDYYGDIDGDGLVNVLEFYGRFAFDPYNSTLNQDRQNGQSPWQGTDPTNPDSDGDLLLDGYEVSNALNATAQDPIDADYDIDSLNNLDEQIYGTDPLDADSDGDGVSDGQETTAGGDPNNPTDDGRVPDYNTTAVVRLTVGDHSGSHSERYILHVGHVSHQSPGYGLVGSGQYVFSAGTYTITLEHSGSKLPRPDYDYTALVQKVGGQASVAVIDSQRILGVHDESSPFFALGKSARLIVTASSCAPNDPTCQCRSRVSCDSCLADDVCAWNEDKKTCTPRHFYTIDIPWGHTVFERNDCPCSRCQRWYDKEKLDTEWLDELNSDIPCPCKALRGDRSFLPANQPEGDWKVDPSCSFEYEPSCTEFQLGAFGCIRSARATRTGAGQQCCYDAAGNLIPPGTRAAGTPDRASTVISPIRHRQLDVYPFADCCTYCDTQPSHCNYYINDVRRGNNSHCGV